MIMESASQPSDRWFERKCHEFVSSYTVRCKEAVSKVFKVIIKKTLIYFYLVNVRKKSLSEIRFLMGRNSSEQLQQQPGQVLQNKQKVPNTSYCRFICQVGNIFLFVLYILNSFFAFLSLNKSNVCINVHCFQK